jgi:hypothetical protein
MFPWRHNGIEIKQWIIHEAKVKLSINRPWRLVQLRDVEAPTFSRLDNRITDGGKVYAPAACYPQEDS